MPDETPEAMADRFTTNANAAFNQFGAALQGSGVDVGRDWEAVQVNAGKLDRVSKSVADGLRNIQEDTSIPEFEKRARANELNATAK